MAEPLPVSKTEADDAYDDECMPFKPPPTHLNSIFMKTRQRALQMHEVYPPSDDTFAMIEAIEPELSRRLAAWEHPCEGGEAAAQVTRRLNVLEVGCGSGMLTAGLLRLAIEVATRNSIDGRAPTASAGICTFACTDKNPIAVECTQETLLETLLIGAKDGEATVNAAGTALETPLQVRFGPCVSSTFADTLIQLPSSESLLNKVDILIFNPPYVVTDDPEEMEGTGISISWAGGNKGREIIDEFLPKARKLLRQSAAKVSDADVRTVCDTPAASFFLCGIWENDPEAIIKLARQKHGLDGKIVIEQENECERLWVIRFELVDSVGA